MGEEEDQQHLGCSMGMAKKQSQRQITSGCFCTAEFLVYVHVWTNVDCPPCAHTIYEVSLED